MINSLKEGSGFEGLDSSTAHSMELEELRHEKEMQKEEIQKLMGQIHQLRSELQVRFIVGRLHSQPRTPGCWQVGGGVWGASVFSGKGVGETVRGT